MHRYKFLDTDVVTAIIQILDSSIPKVVYE